MESTRFSRRSFVKASAAAVAVASLGRVAAAQEIRRRPEWQRFRRSGHLASFTFAIGAMRNNRNAADRSSWAYWADAHQRFCPHGTPYFFAWHRGFLYYFEQQLREVSGNPELQLPYWDYYKYSTLPAEFTDPSVFNPLYVERMTTDVRDALTLEPFRLHRFERGASPSFEASFEPRPHGEIHNLIGVIMAGMRSPLDPIFWVHHAQVDRLWHAWALAAEGRHMPPRTDSYWDGVMTYREGLTMERRMVFDPRAELAYTYDDETMPESLPPQALSRRGFMRASLRGTRKPAMVRVAMESMHDHDASAVDSVVAAPRQLVDGHRSIGGVRNVSLNAKPVIARIAVGGQDRQALQAIADSAEPSAVRKAELVLDDLRVTPLGEAGGYLYRIYLNATPNGSAAMDERRRIGSFGPFEISGAQHHGNSARLAFQLAQPLKDMAPEELRTLDVAFVRVGGKASAGGAVIIIGEVRIELSAE
ncbi:MAG: hypothetical protein JWR25_1777 [Noviherbaspirillum sp.]|nr:hypothetical protein [Noviherbaspirillum sp.]